MFGTVIALAILFGGIIVFANAYEDAKKAGYVSREYIYGQGKEKTPNAVTSDVKSTGR